MRKATVSETQAQYFQHTPAIILDTHIAVWLSARSSIKPSALAILEHAFQEGRLWISPISAWEIGMLVSRNRLDLGQSPRSWFDRFVQQFSVSVLDLTPEIAINSSFLPGDFHDDPADRMIVSSAQVYSATIASADNLILSYGKRGMIKVLPC
ncbi:MAG: type II toxin-antitoxin system VapC family toxin [Candidatus Obscuribacterales bacterium]|jgi:PIN domain nuclease of toxin-antitoxin system